MDHNPREEHLASAGLVVSADLVAVLRELQRGSIQALPPRLTSPDPEPCGEFLRKFREYESQAGDETVTVRSCMPLTVLADVCLMADFPDHRVRFITDHELLVCLQHVAQPSGGLSAVVITARLQQVARDVPSPNNASEVHQHVFNLWKAMRGELDKTRSWGHYKVDGDVFGAWKPSAAKTYSRIMLEALRPHEFRESCRALFVIDKSPLKDPSVFMKLIRDQGLRWPDIQRVLDADRLSRSGRGEIGRGIGDGRNHRRGEVGSSASVAANQYYCQSDQENSGAYERWDQRGTQVYRPERFTGRDPSARYARGATMEYYYQSGRGDSGGSERSERCAKENTYECNSGDANDNILKYDKRPNGETENAILPRSGDIPVLRAKCAATKEAMAMAAPVLLASSMDNVVTTAVPPSIEETKAVLEDNESAMFTAAGGASSTSSEVVHEVFERHEENVKKAAPADCKTAVDQKERIELVVADALVDKRGKSFSTMLGMENACQGHGLVFGLPFRWIMATAAFLPVGTTVLQKTNGSEVFYFRQIDEVRPRTAITLMSATLRARGGYKCEHADARSDEQQQHRIPAIILRDCGWRTSNNSSRRTANSSMKIAGAVELFWLAAMAMGVRVWHFIARK